MLYVDNSLGLDIISPFLNCWSVMKFLNIPLMISSAYAIWTYAVFPSITELGSKDWTAIRNFGFNIKSSYEYGVTDAKTIIGSYDPDDGSFVGIVLMIPKEIENPTLDDVVISKISV